MSADLLIPLLLVVGAVIALGRGGGDPLGQYVQQREARRAPLPPARPRVAAEGRPFNPYPVQPRAIEWVEGVIVPDARLQLEALPVLDVEARDVEPIAPPSRRAIEPRRKAIGR